MFPYLFTRCGNINLFSCKGVKNVDKGEIILEMKGISKVFPGVQALTNVDLTVRRGSLHALIGENGAGKSTLMKVLLGMYAPTEGEIWFKGEKRNFKTPHDALEAGISMIHQEISLVPTLDVAENIWLGREDQMGSKFINWNERYRRTKELLSDIEIEINPHSIVSDLSVAEMQLVELARAVSYNSDIIIMDEPTSALADSEIEKLYAISRRLAAEGKSIIFISHKLEEIFEMCDTVTIMRDSRVMKTCAVNDIQMDELMNLIAGREMTALFPKTESQLDDNDIVFEVKNLCSDNGTTDVSFSLKRGEILGVCGLMGAGRSEIMRAIFGLDKVTSGEIYLEGRKMTIKSPKDAIQSGIAMITEDRLRLGIIPTFSVKNNMSISYLYTITKSGIIDLKKEENEVNEAIKNFSVKCSSPEQEIPYLSGGNQQKVILSRWLMTTPKILILDEPTRGIDVGAKSEIHRLMDEMAHNGVSIIMVSSELPEILGMSDRQLVIKGGRIVGEFARGEATQEDLMKCAFGL